MNTYMLTLATSKRTHFLKVWMLILSCIPLFGIVLFLQIRSVSSFNGPDKERFPTPLNYVVAVFLNQGTIVVSLTALCVYNKCLCHNDVTIKRKAIELLCMYRWLLSIFFMENSLDCWALVHCNILSCQHLLLYTYGISVPP